MRRMNVDTVFRLRFRYMPGQLARVAQTIADEEALIGDLRIVRLGEDFTIRDIVVETRDDEHTRRVEQKIRNLPDIALLSVTDEIFEVHKGGKIASHSTLPLNNVSDLRKVYTPGVARVSLAIQANPALAFEYTSLGKSIGIFTNGTRVLGLGDIGPTASLPVMEGKAALYDQFVGLSAIPVLMKADTVQEMVDTIMRVSPSFGAIHLEDIRSPDCYAVEELLCKQLNKPVMHDDQHGTAVVALAAVINAANMAGISLAKAKVGQIGLGAAGSAIARLMMAYGVQEVDVTDRSEEATRWLADMGARVSTLDEIMGRCDIVLAATGKPRLIQPESVRKGQVLFALSNPHPEIDPEVALAAGAAFASDGKSINNALAFPGIFHGAMKVRARAITPAMKIAAAEAIAAAAERGEFVPDPLDRSVHQRVSDAVAATATREGLANTAQP